MSHLSQSSSLRTSSRILAAGLMSAAASFCMASSITSSGVIILDSGNTAGALTLNGNARVTAPAVYVNSSSTTAVTGNGNTVLQAPTMNLVGAASFTGNAVFTGVSATLPSTVVDPFADTVMPAANTANDLGTISVKKDSITLTPGYYSGGISIRGDANVTFAPGVYVLGNDLSITGGTSVGNGVTFVMLGGHISMSGNGTETFTAPETGSYAGIVIAQPAANRHEMSLAGGNTLSISGTIWAPSAALTITGGASSTQDGPKMGDGLVVNTLTINGNGNVRIGQPTTTVTPPQTTGLHD